MKQLVFLVHGMGRHADGPLSKPQRVTWSAEVQKSLLAAAKAYPQLSVADLVFCPIVYDDVFQSHVKNWAALSKALAGTPFASLTGWMTGAADPSFLWESIGDVALYRLFDEVRQHVLTHVARQIADVVDEHKNVPVEYSVIAHSLGTAVAHDALQKLATVGIDGNHALRAGQFQCSNFFAIANVSRLVWATDERFYDETRVRPQNCGLAAEQCAVKHYVTFRHVADPIPSVVRFVRKSWDNSRFWTFNLRHYRAPNVHGFTHYLESPQVSHVILACLFGSGAVPTAQANQHIAAFPNYLPGTAGNVAQTAVTTMEALLDKLAGASHGAMAHDFDDIGDATLQARANGLLT